MATTYIPINTGQRLGQRLRGAVDTAARNVADLQAIYAIMGTMIDNSQSPPSYALLESTFGLQTGQGATLYALLGQVVTALQNAQAVYQSLVTQCG